jgi:ATP-dependent RNA helicase RhlE
VIFSDLNLNKPLLTALEELGFVYPTAIQKEAFSVVMSGKNIVGIAQTGTGKTFAYLLPLLRLWQYSKSPLPTIVVLVPTRELVVQVAEEVQKLTQNMNFRAVGVYGGANMSVQAQEIYKGCDMVIGTPGRLMDLALNGSLKLSQVNKLVIDEVDEMLNLGFRTQLKTIFDILPKKRQHVMFSATLTEEVEALIADYFEPYVKIEIAPSGTPLEQIELINIEAPNFNTKLELLHHLLVNDTDMDKVLIFAPSKRLADVTHQYIADKVGDKVEVLHSNKSQNYRFNAIERFEEGSCKYLISTDIIARGLDFKNVSHVVNINVPEEPEDFMHRVGRTGRANMGGIAYTFVANYEMERFDAIQELMKKELFIDPLPDDIVISTALIEEEKETYFMKNYLPQRTLKNSGGAFHEKLNKNKKVNQGGPKQKMKMQIKKFGKVLKKRSK